MKYSSSLNSGFFSYNVPKYVQVLPPLFWLSFRRWASGNLYKIADTQAASLAMSKKLSFVADQIDLCLLPAPINWGRLT